MFTLLYNLAKLNLEQFFTSVRWACPRLPCLCSLAS
jgi:hypothetical protein